MAAPASAGLLELQDLNGGQRTAGRPSTSQRRPSDGEEDGEDVPAAVSVRPLLADASATGSSDSQRLFLSSSNATASRHPVRESSVLMHESGSWRSGSSRGSGVASSASPVSREDDHMVAAATGGPIVVAHNLHKTYLLGVEGVPALRGVSLTIARGEFIMILGSSGGGQSWGRDTQLMLCTGKTITARQV